MWQTREAAAASGRAIDPRISRTVYNYGGLGAGYFGNLVLRGDGRVGHYRNDNETTFRLCADRVSFYSAAGELTNTLTYLADGNAFFSRRAGLYLLPVLEMAPAPPAAAPGAPLLINTVPKSGTYLLEAAAIRAGYRPARLHLSSLYCDDYRDLPDAAMHASPEQHRIPIPAAVVAHVLRPGEVAVGHIDEPSQLDGVAQAGTAIVHCVRDLRQVLVSLYRFKRQVVRPVSPAGAIWRAMDEAHGFLGFLSRHAERDIALVARAATAILSRPEPRLRFEDLTGAAPDHLLRGLGGWDGGPARALVDGIIASRGRPTSTLMPPSPPIPWSEAAERFFVETGLARLNAALGYEG